ncbi:MAG: glycogen/starch/alpha-glucan phosphorylase [Kiritimatiellae bacterium]|nr:glycogen/starch/alpha-glucan phosphorylase [Kiritimatiellia bacterium]
MEQKTNHRRSTDRRVEMTTDGLKDDFAWHVRYTQAKLFEDATPRDKYTAFAYCVRDRMIERWLQTQATYRRENVKRVYYLSLEFLMGRLLGNNVINLKIDKLCRDALEEYGVDWNTLRDFEPDAGLGNGGLGRLAACFLDSLSTLDLPAMGYGLRYDYGIFKQKIVNGQQVEEPDHWLKNHYPWEIARPEYSQVVQFGGHVDCVTVNGRTEWHWADTEQVIGLPYDIPVLGYRDAVNTLRLWSAKADNEFHLDDFNQGSYVEAVENKVLAENLTKVLYPNDNMLAGKELRLRQQYFFVSCSLQDILRRFKVSNSDWDLLPEKVFIQLNETHPALVIPELMRILVDQERLDWDHAWRITRRCTAYTNHTVLPEALEKWSVSLMERLLPRHMQIIYEINGRFLRQVAALWPGDVARLARMSIIDEKGDRSVRMSHLAIVGSSAVNGVAYLHTEILKHDLFKDFYELYPSHFSNKTNGITHRRWLLKANPKLADLITHAIGDGWILNLDELQRLEPLTADPGFLDQFGKVKQENKRALAQFIAGEVGITVSPDSIFDVQVKRLHEYKRQLLLTLYIIILYNRLVNDPTFDMPPRTFIFAAKAAPGYAMAKLIIRLIHGVADVVNGNPRVRDKIKVVFLPDYRVSLAERIIPAANLSEQISLAGTEASGTGNMKLMLNGALTIGTLDGANVEIHEAVGDENMFLFGLHAEEVAKLRPTYSSRVVYHNDPEIREALDMIRRNVFCLLSPGLFDPILRSLLDYNDHYMLLADLRSYIETQDRVNALYVTPREWNRKAAINVARSGRFSSDRTITEYARDIWHISPVKVTKE